jgi:NAD(P)-dependent dehydrogenase (short-subunit alcohol dehydrogenase family)
MSDTKTVLVIGASRGLGLALAEEFCSRGWRVIATERAHSEGLAALAARYPKSLNIERVDITDVASVWALRSKLNRSLDTLFVNAGICKVREKTSLDVAESDFIDLMLTNALSPMRALEIFETMVPAKGVIAVMSSEIGSISHNRGHWDLYSASKAALNMLMKCFAARRPSDPRAMLLVAPGWVRTEMGGPGATYSTQESIPEVVAMVERSRGQAGLRFVDRHGRELQW